MKFDSLIIGGGLAGLVCGIRCAQAGLKTGIISRGESGLAFSSGTIDLMGTGQNRESLIDPFKGIEWMLLKNPEHPYGKVGLDNIHQAMSWFQTLSREIELPYAPIAEGKNQHRITALGALRPTYLSPASMVHMPIEGKQTGFHRVAVVNIEGFRDFQPELARHNLRCLAEFQGVEVVSATIKLPSEALGNRDPGTMRSVELSRQLDSDRAISILAEKLKAAIGHADLVLLPSVLSLSNGSERLAQLSELSGYKISELATLPPSLPGLRLSERLQQRFHRLGGLMMSGDKADKGIIEQGKVQSISTHGNNQMALIADHIILASGSFMSGGLVADRNRIRESIFGLDVNTDSDRPQWANQKFLNGKAHAFTGFGVVVDQYMRPRKDNETVENLYCIGSVLGHAQPVEEGSAGGIAISTGWAAAERIIQKAAIQQKTAVQKTSSQEEIHHVR
ncbi:anaerobic glycerol-3-phosphate dehydrogenase subunit B [Endozoicomonas sp. OPT23]|uniref:glycerol-3-phosphate dehydrogenase subunit GlpB n=1 Tax=Endozoicomonas sp. OPT23 TaxID=2072845 RepID=UPI00129BD138|nr:glycerol-3-phosphate dehydrogenase subunit GlpB [Endozoicomonas sp. OPT23]MRI32711.1 anaerobic glycerol-3-phosphate dehydrogenase subunit B [Endozoicomonas sp. OPT23]